MQSCSEPMDTSTQFCPNEACSARGQIGAGNIRIHSYRPQRYRCQTCKGSKKIKISRGVWYTPNKDSLEEEHGPDGRAEELINRDGRATQRQCSSAVSGTHGQSPWPWWCKPSANWAGIAKPFAKGYTNWKAESRVWMPLVPEAANWPKNICPTCSGISELLSTGKADPQLKTNRLYTRLTASEVRRQLIAKFGYRDEELPTATTIGAKLNQLGYYPTKVAKSKPKKSWQPPMRSSSS